MIGPTYFCTGCWIRDHGVGGSPALHHHREGCFERHRVFGERLSPELVARYPTHECRWPNCKDGGIYRKPVPASPSEHGGGDRCEACDGKGTIRLNERHTAKCEPCGGTGQRP